MTVVDLRDRISLGRLSIALPAARRSPELVSCLRARELYRAPSAPRISRLAVLDFMVALLVTLLIVPMASGVMGAVSRVVLASAWFCSLVLSGAYASASERSGRRTLTLVARTTLLTAGAAALLSVGFPDLAVGPISATILAIAVGTVLARALFERPLVGRPVGDGPMEAVVRGTAQDVAAFLERLGREDRPMFVPRAVQITEGSLPDDEAVAPSLDRILPSDDVVPWAEMLEARAVVLVGPQPEASPELRRMVWRLEGRDIGTYAAPFVADLARPRVASLGTSGVPILGLNSRNAGAEIGITKVVVDKLLALAVLIVLAPVLALTAAAIKLTSEGPVLFRQVRVGLGGRKFEMLKFRTMTVDAEQRLAALAEQNRHTGGTLFKIPNDPRVTRVGRVLRKYSLDELPQLVNVLRGEMSLVGPRPSLPQEVANYPLDAHRRFCVRPGLTGLWQVSGRSDLDPEQSIHLDTHYVEQWSPSLDVRILAKTPKAVLSGDGAY
jgi:exopolysaccharide biosynthesis polyprenyl glycosylphosphotransferase